MAGLLPYPFLKLVVSYLVNILLASNSMYIIEPSTQNMPIEKTMREHLMIFIISLTVYEAIYSM
jgi:hypothetical protein